VVKLSLVGYRFGYKEDVIIRHLDTTAGQYERYPEYFEKEKLERRIMFIILSLDEILSDITPTDKPLKDKMKLPIQKYKCQRCGYNIY